MIYGWLYRSLMKLAHRYDWHYAPVIGPISSGYACETPTWNRWCKWCGMCHSYRYDPRLPLSGPLSKRLAGRKPPADFMADCGSPKLNDD